MYHLYLVFGLCEHFLGSYDSLLEVCSAMDLLDDRFNNPAFLVKRVVFPCDFIYVRPSNFDHVSVLDHLRAKLVVKNAHLIDKVVN